MHAHSLYALHIHRYVSIHILYMYVSYTYTYVHVFYTYMYMYVFYTYIHIYSSFSSLCARKESTSIILKPWLEGVVPSRKEMKNSLRQKRELSLRFRPGEGVDLSRSCLQFPAFAPMERERDWEYQHHY